MMAASSSRSTPPTAQRQCSLLSSSQCVVKSLTAGECQSLAQQIEGSVELNADASHLLHKPGAVSSIAQHSTIQHCTLQVGAVQHICSHESKAHCGMTLKGTSKWGLHTALHCKAQSSRRQHSTARHSTTQHSSVYLRTYSPAQHSAAQPKDMRAHTTQASLET